MCTRSWGWTGCSTKNRFFGDGAFSRSHVAARVTGNQRTCFFTFGLRRTGLAIRFGTSGRHNNGSARLRLKDGRWSVPAVRRPLRS